MDGPTGRWCIRDWRLMWKTLGFKTLSPETNVVTEKILTPNIKKNPNMHLKCEETVQTDSVMGLKRASV